MKVVRAEYKLIHPAAKLPTKGRLEDAGYDVYSIEEGEVRARNNSFWWTPAVFRTGLRIAVPTGYFISVRGRSGIGFKGIQPFIGTLDATYNGELLIMLLNHSNSSHRVNIGDRIAQIVVEEQIAIDPIEVEEFSEEYDKRGKSGFGSSGS